MHAKKLSARVLFGTEDRLKRTTECFLHGPKEACDSESAWGPRLAGRETLVQVTIAERICCSFGTHLASMICTFQCEPSLSLRWNAFAGALARRRDATGVPDNRVITELTYRRYPSVAPITQSPLSRCCIVSDTILTHDDGTSCIC